LHIGADLVNARDRALLQQIVPDDAVRAVAGPQDAHGIDLLVLDIRRLTTWQPSLQAWRSRPKSYLPVLALVPAGWRHASDLPRLAALVDDWQVMPLKPWELRARLDALRHMAAFSRHQQQRTLALLAVSERRYREIAELLADYCYALRFDAQDEPVLDWASPDTRRLGLSAEALARLGGISGLLLSCSQGRGQRQIALARAGQASEEQFQLPNGRWVAHKMAPLREGEAIVGAFAALIDIDAQHRQVEELILLRHALDVIPSLVQLWRQGEPRPRLSNPIARRLLAEPQAQALIDEQVAALPPAASRVLTLTLGDAPYELLLTRSANPEGGADIILVAGRDISERLRQEAALGHAASHDALTGLPHRARFVELCRRALGTLAPGKRHALVMLDFAGLKAINESLGHEAGDEALKTAAQRLQACLSPQQPLARLGGNAFAVLVPDTTPEAAARLAELWRALLDEPIPVAGTQVQLEPALGLALAPDGGTAPATLLRHVESALRSAHDAGGRRVMFFRREQNEQSKRRLRLEAELHEALRQGEFRLHYQLQWPTHAGPPFGVEALLRWQHPQRGLLPPGEFIDVLEASPLIHAVGLWVLEEACRQWQRWREAGIEPPHIAVNVAPAQFQGLPLAEAVAKVLAAHDVPPQVIELELTESTLMRDLAQGRQQLAALKQLGVALALDDFGTGHSSLAYLAQLPFDRLKIDRSFVQPLPDDATAAELARTIVLLAGGLGLRVIAEGVETEAQAAFLRRCGCHWLQGYLLSPPRPADDIPALIARGQKWLKRHTD
jgi:diguanylate cyclase (GGDEF)-like protein